MVYAIHVEQLERDVLGERQIAAMLATSGAENVDMPTMAEQRARFDEALNQDPLRSTDDQTEWRRAMGLG